MSLLLDTLVLIGCVYVLTITVEQYFVPALREIAHRYRINEDIAGATLMAAGSSSPELAIALISLFIAGGGHGDIGAGTIVGSAVFNILVISGICGLIRPLEIPRSVLSRDCIFYLIGVALLLYSLRDGSIELIESILFLISYLIYLLFLYGWNRYFDDKGSPLTQSNTSKNNNDMDDYTIFNLQSGLDDLLRRFIGSPRSNHWRVFLTSIGLVGIASYVLVDSAVSLAQETGIPEVLIGLTVIAIATSVPDLLSSISASRSGHGGMAVSNAVGSNIFDILVGLGGPWLIVISLTDRALPVATDDLWNSALVLVSTVAVLYLFLFTNRRLNRLESTLLLLFYVGYVITAYLGW